MSIEGCSRSFGPLLTIRAPVVGALRATTAAIPLAMHGRPDRHPQLRKELSGTPLFDGVSFKVERRDRLALSGPNGAGKTTLLRIARRRDRAPRRRARLREGHAGRAPRPAAAARARLSLRDYVLGGAADLVAIEDELRRLEQAMAGGDHDAATLRRYAEAQARLEHAGGYDWRDARRRPSLRGLGFARRRPRPPAPHLLRRRADAGLARRARSPATPICSSSTSRRTTSTSRASSGWRRARRRSTRP